MPPFDHAAVVWLVIVLIIAWFTLGSLRVIGYEYFNAVTWHNLRVRVQGLRQHQERRLRSLQRDGGAAAPPSDTAPAMPASEPAPAAAVEVEMGEAA